MEDMKKFMEEHYKGEDVDSCQLVIDAKKEVFDDVDKYLDAIDKQIPWHLILSHGGKGIDVKPSYDDIKKKHLGDKMVKEGT